MTRQPPAERTLPDKQQMLDRILADNQEIKPRKKRPIWVVPAIAAAAVAGIVGAAMVGPQAIRSSEPAPPADKSQQNGKDAEVDVDLGPLSAAEIKSIRQLCLFSGTVKQVVHATKVKSGWGDGVDWSIALKGHDAGGNGRKPGDNRLTACSGRPNGKTDGTLTERGVWLHDFWTTTGPAPTAEELAKRPPNTPLFYPQYDDSFRPIEGFLLMQREGKLTSSQWIKVPDEVRRVRQRLLIEGKATQWFSSQVVDNLSFVQTWSDGPMPATPQLVKLEVQFLDAADQPVLIPGSTGVTTSLDANGLQLDRKPTIPNRGEKSVK